MRREIRELAVLIAAGTLLGLGHLALRPDMPLVAPPREEAALCGSAAPAEPEPIPEALVSSPDAPMSVPMSVEAPQ